MDNKIVTFGEIMLRLATPGFERFCQARQLNTSFGGGEANVAVSLANFGLKVDYVTRLPKNDLGETCLVVIVLEFTSSKQELLDVPVRLFTIAQILQ